MNRRYCLIEMLFSGVDSLKDANQKSLFTFCSFLADIRNFHRLTCTHLYTLIANSGAAKIQCTHTCTCMQTTLMELNQI